VVLRDCDEPEDAADWIDYFSSTHPVLCDSELVGWDLYGVGTGKPQYTVFDREMNIVYRSLFPSDRAVAEAAVLDLLMAE
jgi:hypothetical protein